MVKISLQCRWLGFDSWVGKIRWRRKWNLAWEVPWTEEPAGLQLMGWQTVGHDWATSTSTFTFWSLKNDFIPNAICVPASSALMYVQSLRSGPTLCNPWTVAHRAPWNFSDENTGVGLLFLLQGIFPTQGSNPCLLHPAHWQLSSMPLAPPGNRWTEGKIYILWNACHYSCSWGVVQSQPVHVQLYKPWAMHPLRRTWGTVGGEVNRTQSSPGPTWHPRVRAEMALLWERREWNSGPVKNSIKYKTASCSLYCKHWRYRKLNQVSPLP